MKKGRLFILIFTMLICMVLVGCNENKKIEDLPIDTETESNPQPIKATVVSKYNEKEITIYSDTSCFFYVEVSVNDGETTSQNKYGEFEISGGETITLTLNDLAPGFFSEQAIITKVLPISPYVYEYSSLNSDNFKSIDSQILMKYSSKEITVYSSESCFFNLWISTNDLDFSSCNVFQKLEIKKGETITLTLDDLAPGFFDDETSIQYVNPSIDTYIEEK